jgi:two-component system sensor histidine kinase KdpD
MSRDRARQWLLWFGVLGAVTGALLLLRDRLDKTQVALVFLLVVLGGSAAAGRALGVMLAVVAFLAFDVGFLPPYDTIRVADWADWIVLLAFLVTGIVAAELLERQRREAEIARARTTEIDRLATLGAETLNAPRPEDALRAISDVIREAMQTDRCEITLVDSPEDGYVLPHEDGFGRLPSRELHIPLRVRTRLVGTLRLSADRPFLLSRDQWRVLAALSYYAALGVERVRLAASEDEAVNLRRADRLKDALLASVSHDLRTPLTAIKGIANEIARGEDPTRAHVIEEEADRLGVLVDNLLDLSQLEAGEMRLAPAVNTADDVVGSALQRVEPAYPERTFVAQLTDPWVDLVGRFDFVATMRILINLLENAARYAPPSSTVRLRVWREGETLRFAVEDDGAGIPAADRERLFDPFIRGSTRPPGARGTGLGLSIARRLASAQGGRLEYEPTAEIASRFVLSLPAAEVVAE